MAPIVAMLAASFALGGSARGDVAGLIVLRPTAAVMLGIGLLRIRREELARHHFVAGMALALVALPALQLVPLPYDVWSRLPGRDPVVAIDQAAGLGRIARPLTMTPDATVNALLSLLVPVSILALGLGLNAGQRRYLLPVLLLLGAASALMGLSQIAGGPGSSLYLYDVTNPGSAVGIFANRNHAAALLAMMLPMLAVLWLHCGQENRLGQTVAVLFGLTLLPLILITGSRAGLLLAALGMVSIPFVLASPSEIRPTRRQAALLVAAIALVGGLAAATIHLGRAEAWSRLFASGTEEDARLRVLPTLIDGISRFFPWGSGAGSFEQVFEAIEPDALLAPAVMNHAHNDWLEPLMTCGLAALLLEAVALAAFARTLYRSVRQNVADGVSASFARLGIVLIAMAALASVGDYPLRTPALAAVFAVAVLWAGDGMGGDAAEARAAQC